MPQQPASSSVSIVFCSDMDIILAANHVTEYVLNGGSNDMAVDGTTPVTFSYTPPAGKDFKLHRMMLYLETSTAMDSIEFGNISVLSNGVQINVAGENLTTWKDNIDMLADMFDLDQAGEAFGKVTRTLSGRWTFAKDVTGKALLIPDGQSFDVVIRDNLSTLSIFRLKVKGLLTPTFGP